MNELVPPGHSPSFTQRAHMEPMIMPPGSSRGALGSFIRGLAMVPAQGQSMWLSLFHSQSTRLCPLNLWLHHPHALVVCAVSPYGSLCPLPIVPSENVQIMQSFAGRFPPAAVLSLYIQVDRYIEKENVVCGVVVLCRRGGVIVL